eukprot:403345257
MHQLNDEEYSQYLQEIKRVKTQSSSNNSNDIFETVDWVTYGAVTRVKDQLQCGSCWAFAAVGAIEGSFFLKYNLSEEFSVQQLVDCSPQNTGCNGGLMTLAYQYLEGNQLLEFWSDYPYIGYTQRCKYNKNFGRIRLQGYVNVAKYDANELQKAVQQQPISIAIESDSIYIQFYNSGIVQDVRCGTQVDHGVLIVGYGYDVFYGEEYWLVKNSWGADWGENGYFRILKNALNGPGICGIQISPQYPILS